MRPKEALTVAIDGPAGAGKSTVAREVARKLELTLVDTGAIYRTVALVATRRGIGLDDDTRLQALVEALPVRFAFDGEHNRTFLGEEDVTDFIRTAAISRAAADVSGRAVVRAGLLALQRNLAGSYGAVLEGRDIGTVVCPEAPLKFFLEASIEARARRRHDEQISRGETSDLDEVYRELVGRDEKDRNREHAPLRAAHDAMILDSTHLTARSVIATIEMSARLWLQKVEEHSDWAVALAQRLANEHPGSQGTSGDANELPQVSLRVRDGASVPDTSCLAWQRHSTGSWIQPTIPLADRVSLSCSLEEAKALGAGDRSARAQTAEAIEARVDVSSVSAREAVTLFLRACR